MAKLAKYYGVTYDYVLDMTPGDFNNLFEAMEIMEAQQQLRSMVVADWPNLKTERRKQIISDLEKRAKALAPKKKLEFTAEALKDLINGR